MRLDKLGRRVGYNWWRDLIVSSWIVADTAWRQDLEVCTKGYSAEEEQHKETYPRPTLKLFMIGLKHKGEDDGTDR